MSQFSNQQLNISLCFRRSLFRLLTTSKDPTELWSLLCSSLSPFSVIKSRLSKSPVMLPKSKRRLLMMFNISATKVSHYRTEKFWFSKFSSVVSLIWQIFLSTLPWIWWAAPEHILYSSFILEWNWPFKSEKLIFIKSHPERSWLPSPEKVSLGIQLRAQIGWMVEWKFLCCYLHAFDDCCCCCTVKHMHQYFDYFALIK